jgi:hypothetical protein
VRHLHLLYPFIIPFPCGFYTFRPVVTTA